MGLTCNSFNDVLEELGEMISLEKIIIGEGVLCNFDLFILHNVDGSNISATKHKISQILLSYPTYNSKCLLEIITEYRVFNFTFYQERIKDMQRDKRIADNGDLLFFSRSDMVEWVEKRMVEDFYAGFEYLKRTKEKYDKLFPSISSLWK